MYAAPALHYANADTDASQDAPFRSLALMQSGLRARRGGQLGEGMCMFLVRM
jgi:hypothetical protein